MAIEIVDFPIENGDFKLPEGNHSSQVIPWCVGYPFATDDLDDLDDLCQELLRQWPGSEWERFIQQDQVGTGPSGAEFYGLWLI